MLILMLLGSWFLSDSMAQSFPVPSTNAWKDDYRDISDMKHYLNWGTYNVHDPSCKKIGDTYYIYSTDAIYRENKEEASRLNIPLGFVQMRSSKDLVHWKFEGWAFSEIPEAAKEWVLSHSGNTGATNIWAPYLVEYKGKYRLYYCVSAFGQQNSYIGMAESDSPTSGWVQKGCVVRTQRGDKMNAIDPSIVTDASNGKMWMHYGSFFGGLYAVEINPETGLTATANDQGHLIAKRANLRHDNIEAPEIIYQPKWKKYYLFTSYDPLMTTYNLRVGRSDRPEGPFLDYFGKNLSDTIDHYPILTYPYRFKNHTGWAGTAHCSVFEDGKGEFFLAHQGRLSPDNHLMDLHVREVKWTNDGWPVVSPERFSGKSTKTFSKADLFGNWEIIVIDASKKHRKLEAGQILWGENHLIEDEQCRSKIISLSSKGSISGEMKGRWSYANKTISLQWSKNDIVSVTVFVGHDWENETETLLFTGIDHKGRSVWGKRIK